MGDYAHFIINNYNKGKYLKKFMINKNDIEQYIKKFYGYGNWKSPIWFVGIEEGGGNSEKEIKNRINSWLKYKTDLIDIKEHHINIGICKYFTKGTLQNTWRKLIRIKLSYERKSIDNDIIRDIQKNKWGQLKSDNALIELFPLPSPNNTDWFYDEWTNIKYLNDRDSYYSYISEIRLNHIKSRINKYKPKVVLLYANSMLNYWSILVGDDFEKYSTRIKIKKNYVRILKKNHTCFVQTPQPAGVYSNDFWEYVGKEIRKICP